MNAGWFHNGGLSTDNPRVEYVQADDFGHANQMSDGPFETFHEAKADLLHLYDTMRASFTDARRVARKLKEPKCARKACENLDPEYFNSSTRAMYCYQCSVRINRAAGQQLCTRRRT